MSEYSFWYYCVYSWCLRTWGSSDQPQWNAALGLSLAGALNLGSLVLIFNNIGSAGLRIPTEGFAIAYVLLLAFHYWIFVRAGRYLEIARSVESDPLRNRRSTLTGWLYVLGSPIAFISLVAMQGTRNAA